ncbi:MAG: type IV pilus secretin PilQ [Elusimicrobia bacterium]|nr:type IV pilus secretin PilQ [Elusimicrobiota bacterium]
MKNIFSIFLAATLLNPGPALVWAASGSRLKNIEVRPDEVRIQTTKPVRYRDFVTATPPRLVLELIDTQNDFPQKVLAGKGEWIRQVRSGQFQKEPLLTRVVLDLARRATYRISSEPSGLVVSFRVVNAGTLSSNPPPSTAPTGTTEMKEDPMPLEDKLSDEMEEEVQKAAPKVAALPRMIPPPSSRAGRISTIDILANLPTEPIQVDFDATDVRDALRLLANRAGFNIIYGADVVGTLTLHLVNVPFNEVFKTILSMKGLATDQVGNNILRVSSPQSLLQERQNALPITKVVALKYSRALDVKNQVDSVSSAEGRKGTTTTDMANNALIVTATPDAMESISRLISQLDQRPKQVLIESKLVEVSLNKDLQLGIQWDYKQTDLSRTSGGFNSANMIGQTDNPYTAGGTGLAGGALAGVGIGAGGRGTGVFLPADRIFGALTLGRVTDNYYLTATLSAAASKGKVKVLSDPKVATLNNQPATINITTQIPYVTSNVTSTGVSTQQVSYVTVGIILTVTPTINADGRVTLKVNPSVSQPSASSAASSTGAPAVDTRNANTTVMVKDGETIVIGGLITDRISDTIAKVPLLGDIPILGWLFKKKTTSRTRQELLIFVTTKILPD